MKSTVEHLSPTRVKINVEVPFDELKSNFDRAYKKIAHQVRIPGFRPGKAPARILEQRLGRGVVLDEVVNEAIPAKYTEFVNSGAVHPLGRPDIEVTEIEDGDHLVFTAEVDVRPQIDVPAYGEFAVSVDDIEVTDDEIDEQLNGLRTRFGTLTGVDRAVERGDFVMIDLSATVDGEDVEDAATNGLSYEVGSGQLIEGIDDALVGASEGEQRTFTTTLVAGKQAGRDAEVTVRLGAVKLRELPEADDEFAQLASEFDTLDELKADLRERLGKVKSMQQGAQARDKVIEELLAATDVPLPESLVQAEVKTRLQDAVQVFDGDEQRFAEWLDEQEMTHEQFETDLETSARDVVKTRLILDTIADAEELTVDQNELMERIVMQAQRYGMSPNEFVQRAQTAGELGLLYTELRRGKALATVVAQATVTDASGKSVDIEALFGRPAQQGAESVDAESVDAAPAEVAPAEVAPADAASAGEQPSDPAADEQRPTPADGN
ncbi:MAG TPA: trigger factor [Pseudonocardiaceae bacterium]